VVKLYIYTERRKRKMAVTINGEEIEAAGKTLADYLKEAGYDTRGIAIERNGEIVPRSRYAVTRLQDGDKIEVVHCVAGG
jgi:sulfur carrier protein